ncbi:hypothetical protein J2Z65_005282 [Paenibacillus aceris]|uniref:Uncharacterized protein n=1 Tax=Paenibacillus aceris TaxID=869555 RepID=A0ABS4I7E4_9BACL|nr:hypothetical protein [Paenibacillus aceris]
MRLKAESSEHRGSASCPGAEPSELFVLSGLRVFPHPKGNDDPLFSRKATF